MSMCHSEVIKNTPEGGRESGIELFRILTMLVIVAHHYFVNSGLSTLVYENPAFSKNSVFLLLFGWGGKTGINCFVLITGYFMCRSRITLKKFLKLLLWMEFYKIVFYAVFLLTGYQEFQLKSMIKALLPISSIADGFGSAYLAFFLFIPFLNILIKGMNKKQHLTLIALCLGVYTVLATLKIRVVFNYVTWFSVIYIIGAYLRIYPEKWFTNNRVWGLSLLVSLLLSWCSVLAGLWVFIHFGKNLYYYFVADSNKPLAVTTAICAFMYFKNLHLGHNKAINKIAASAYGVLLIHANSDTMRQWLWRDTLHNVNYIDSGFLFLHAICSVVGIYILCTVIDMLRIQFFERPFFSWYDKKLYARRIPQNEINDKYEAGT